MKDLRGRDIDEGDDVIWTSRRSGVLHIGKVSKVRPNAQHGTGRILVTFKGQDAHKASTWLSPEQIMVVTE